MCVKGNNILASKIIGIDSKIDCATTIYYDSDSFTRKQCAKVWFAGKELLHCMSLLRHYRTVHRSVGDCLLVSYRSIVIVIKIVAPPPTSLMITITIQHARQ